MHMAAWCTLPRWHTAACCLHGTTKLLRRTRRRGALYQRYLPSGLAFADNGDILIANYGTDLLEQMSRSGETVTLHDNIDGKPMGKVNFLLRDSKNRIWITISTRAVTGRV